MSWSDPLHGNPRYESIRTLSRGTRSFVQLALDRSTGEHVAIKFTQRGVLSCAALVGSCFMLLKLVLSTLLQLLCYQASLLCCEQRSYSCTQYADSEVSAL
jgi:serine/threonine protein kinase